MPHFISNTIQMHVAAIDTKSNKISYLLIQRSDKARVYPSMWQVVTGRIEENETAVEAAKRELKEETGLEALKFWTLPMVATYFDPVEDRIHASPVFGVVVDIDIDIILSDEHQGHKWVDFDVCLQCLPIPSHAEGTKIFRDYVLLSAWPDLFSHH